MNASSKNSFSIRNTLAAACLGLLAITAIALPVISLNAQTPAPTPAPAGQGRGGGGGRGSGGGRGAAAPVNNPAPTSPVSGNASLGKPLYYNHGCYGCHGFNGETGRAFVGRWGNLATEAGFLAFLRARADQNPRAASTGMPNYPVNALSDKDAKDIYAYIRTFKSNAPELKNIPTLNAIVSAASRPYKP
jgi:mono/diheme cytochrome c family protein